MKTWLFLLRHGATRLNLETPYRLQGSEVDEPLTPLGYAQAEAAAQALRHVPLAGCYSSPLSRAKQTAEIVATPHALPVTTIADLREGSVGRWENRTWEDIQAKEPEAYHAFMEDPGLTGYAGGENFYQVLARVKPVIWGLLERHAGQCIVVVGHQIVNRVIVAELTGLPMAAARRVKFANGGITSISTENDKPILVSLNMTWPLVLTPA
jgi:broad specificity phosphatase PhoE